MLDDQSQIFCYTARLTGINEEIGVLLKDKVVLVTGSTTGIGEAIARRAVAEGAHVMVHGRNEGRAQKLCEELGTDKVKYCLGDLIDIEFPAKLVAATVEQFGRLDILINNAGLSPRNNLDTVTPEAFDWIFSLDVRAPLFLVKAAVAHFRQREYKGMIVNIGSINAYSGETAMLAYSMAKGALMTMTRNLADALNEEGIRINQLNVGWTLTKNESALKEEQGFPKDWEQYIPKTYAPSGRLVRPEEVAAHAVFWASEQSMPASGQVYEVEQYPVIGRNLINTIPLDVFPQGAQND